MLFVKQEMVDAAANRVNAGWDIFFGVRRLAAAFAVATLQTNSTACYSLGA
jgi:hypothetical protein